MMHATRAAYFILLVSVLSGGLIGLGPSGCGGGQAATTSPLEAPSGTEPGLDGRLHIHFLDVGQGDGAVIVTPSGRVVMVDAGPPEAGPDVLAALERLGVVRINLALASHAHADHIGGFLDVFESVPVMRYGDPGYPHTSLMYANLLEQVEARGTASYRLRRGQRILLGDGIEMRVLAPPADFLTGTRSDINSNSLILLLSYGDLTVLLMGDAEAETEQSLLAAGLVEDVDVLKVAHHGSAYATGERFLAEARPEVAVISCGRDNSYGHPAPETVSRLQAMVADGLYITSVDGAISLESDGTGFEITTTSGPPVAFDATRDEGPRLVAVGL